VGYVDEKLSHLATTVALEAQRTREAFAAGQQETKDALRVTGSRPTPMRAGQVTSAGGRLVGWSLLADDSDATVTFHDGQTADGDVVAVETIAAGAASTRPIPVPGVTFVHGLFAEVTGGPVTGAVWLGAVD
jgi:hypothetical protein